ncbi:hypothetical protein EIN_473140 [Entamoeba invadens IP1]|uniref:EF-hand domain-containing protein n=1 Tax=Entamoeba invadens IP1 TaxID=370355 RepID=A0A0A1U6H3_ENTIV|nr:hypothetical protein EIN_473140 [Entamoeba invadens IP1]ELP89906.1 hypothetical protein EIN_473140 [Entamoeba invadens IP1]|eukprot:XP_004256677.1 hypothetical protein EIN_473140 [Entamoeba invadens IP1]
MAKAKQLFPNFEQQQDDFETLFYFGTSDDEDTITLEKRDFIFNMISKNLDPRGMMPTVEDMCEVAYKIATFGGKKGLDIEDYMRIRQKVTDEEITREEALESYEYYDIYKDNILNNVAFVNSVNEEQPIDETDPPLLVDRKMKRYAYKVLKREDKDHSNVFGREKFLKAMKSVILEMESNVTENDENLLLFIYKLKEHNNEIDSETFMNLVVTCLICFNDVMEEDTLNNKDILESVFLWFVGKDKKFMSLEKLDFVLEKLNMSINNENIIEFLKQSGCETGIFVNDFIDLFEWLGI